ncbi:MAG: amino acid ABC transporter substrate-binding protein [Thermodesulfobacteriota bacterium]
MKKFVIFSFLSCLVTGLALTMPGLARAAGEAPLTDAETYRLGEQMYLKGLLPSGKPMQAFVSGDIPVEGTSFTCVSCHLRSGIGSFEGNVATSPTNGRILYQERKPHIKGGSDRVPSYYKYASYFPARPAYTDDSLAELITDGVDPTGRSVVEVMPRYELDDRDMDILIAYLKTLSDKHSPGVTETEIKFATVIGEDADPALVEAMLVPIEFNVKRKNSQALTYKNNARLARMAFNMMGPELAEKRFSLARWVLKGPSSTWQEQLEAYYQADPVFVLLGGITGGDWEPIHRFCEEHRIPNLLPLTDYPVISDSDWYTLYFSRGIRQEGEAAARWLHSMHDLFADRNIVQVIRDNRMGNTLAEGFRESWGHAGEATAREMLLKGDEPLTAERLKEAAGGDTAVLVVWDDATSLPALEKLAAAEGAPGIILASGSFLGKEMWNVPETLRKSLHLTYPHRLPQDEERFDLAVRVVTMGKNPENYDQKVLRQSFIIGEMLGSTLVKMRGEFYRDYFFDVIGMKADATYPLYERIGFGPGQRYASKGCYIVQLGAGETPRLEKKSEWVTQ